MTEQQEITIAPLPLSVARNLALVRAMVDSGQREGTIPKDRHLVDPSEKCICAMDDGRFVGVAVFYDLDDWKCIFLDILYVRPTYRRLGIGSMLLSMVETSSPVGGEYPLIRFGTISSNEPMHAFAAKHGFAPYATFFTKDRRDA